ncbi:MAG: hypothetical protein ACLFN8_01195 [Candidatus Woesearchaeota archaeon]
MKSYKDSVGRVYLYLFSMLGLVLIVIGSVGLINLGLKNLVFNAQDPWSMQPPMPYFTNKLDTLETCDDLSAEDRILLDNWLRDYEAWEATAERANNYRDREGAARNLALLIVGIPLFLFHWRLVRE